MSTMYASKHIPASTHLANSSTHWKHAGFYHVSSTHVRHILPPNAQKSQYEEDLRVFAIPFTTDESQIPSTYKTPEEAFTDVTVSPTRDIHICIDRLTAPPLQRLPNATPNPSSLLRLIRKNKFRTRTSGDAFHATANYCRSPVLIIHTMKLAGAPRRSTA